MTAFKDWLNGLTSKTTPVDADELYVRDSSGTPGSKKLTWANLVATLKTAFNSLTLTGGTATASSPVLTTTQTWNNAGVTFVGKTTNITDTASAAGSLFEDWQVGGASKASVRKSGRGTFYDLYTGNDLAVYANDGQNAGATSNRACMFGGSIGSVLSSNFAYAWSSVSFGSPGDCYLNRDLLLYRDAANALGQRNSTNAQTSRLYGTYTDASNYRRLAYTMSTAGVAEIKPEGAGTGASGNVLHISGLPTSNPGAGILWNDGGTVKVGT